MDAHDTFKPIVALLAASLFSSEGALAEARYGVAAMVGKSAPNVATAITKAVENEGARWFRLDSSNTAIRRDMNERLLRAQADSNSRAVSGLSAPKATVDLAPSTSQPVPAIPPVTAPLQGKLELEDEIRRVREMLAQSQAESPSINEEANALEAQVAKPEVAPQPEPFVYPKLEDALAAQNPASNRLLASMQETERRVVAARIRAIKDSSTKKTRYGNLSNASGGTELHASLEFNRSIRGTAPSQRGRSIRYASKRDDQQAGYGGEPTVGAFGPSRGTQGTLGFTETPSRFAAFPRPATPEAFLRRHKPEYQESGINAYEAGKNAAGDGRKGTEVAGNGEILSRHKTNFQDSGINAYENKSSGGASGSGGTIGADGSVSISIPGLLGGTAPK